LIYTSTKCRRQKKKPGWKDVAAQEAAWLKSINSMTAFSTTKYQGRVSTPGTRSPVVDGTLVGADRPKIGKSLNEFGGAGTKKVLRPEITYKEDPELLARELKARERKFNVSPVFNKSGDMYVTEEELVKVLSSNKRRS
jgi:hypothetical protein